MTARDRHKRELSYIIDEERKKGDEDDETKSIKKVESFFNDSELVSRSHKVIYIDKPLKKNAFSSCIDDK